MNAAQRLDGSGFTYKKYVSLRYSLAPMGNYRVLAFSK